MSGPRVLLAVSADTSRDTLAGPRRDYRALAAATGAAIVDRGAIGRSRAAHGLQRLFGLGPALAWLAFSRRATVDVIVSDGEHVGIPLAALLLFTRSAVKHVTIGHKLSAPKKRRFFTLLGVHRRMDRIVVHAREQARFAREELGVEDRRLSLVPYQVDTEFWKRTEATQERLVVSAGLEFRDYQTLMSAVDGIDARVVIAAASHWSRHAFAGGAIPKNVTIASFDYASLRELYERAALVVVPLEDVDNQAGVTTILEAMAMGRPLVVTQSRGQTDVVEDRRRSARGTATARPTSLARLLAEHLGVPIEPNGFYVAPRDAASLRSAILYLLDHPEERAILGRAGRRAVERLFTLEQFATRMRSVIDEVAAPAPEPGAHAYV